MVGGWARALPLSAVTDCLAAPSRRLHPQFLPFIQGPRNCLGQYFALLEARVILSTLCQVRLQCLEGGQ